MAASQIRMMPRSKTATRALDGAAAAILAAAVGFAATAAGSVVVAVPLTLLVFVLAFAVLGQVADEPVHRLARFELQTFDCRPSPGPAAAGDPKVVCLFGHDRPASTVSGSGSNDGAAPGDARRALSEALAALRRSLH